MTETSSPAWGRGAVLTVVALGGVLGAVARHALGRAFADVGGLPWGTLVANILGSLALGVVVALVPRTRAHPLWYPFLGAGFLGSVTTMSGFQVETVLLVDDGRPVAAVVYVVLTLAVGLVAGAAGLRLGRSGSVQP